MIVNTRPEELSQKTNSLLKSSHQNFIHIPFTRIFKTEPSSKTLEYINNLKDYDVLIFTSQSAVTYGHKFYQETIAANINIPILAIGLATQKSLRILNLTSSIPPTFDSAGLANVIKKMGYKKCLVFCGEKNPRIATMTDAELDTFPCYASHDETNIDVSKIRDKNKLVILIYTHQSLKVLMKELPVNKNQLMVLIVASKRIKGLAEEYGFRNIVLAESPHDKEMVKAALEEV
jgi:uroporphyrinogen-III synthase